MKIALILSGEDTIKMETHPIFIYALIDPISNEIRYIGKSMNPLKRLTQHLCQVKNNTKTHKRAWLKSLLDKGLKPNIKILEVTSKNNWEFVEKSLIKFYNNKITLLNLTPGGEGVPKGTIPWNKGLKGVSKRNKGSFVKGEHRSSATEIKNNQRLSPKTEFKCGQIPFNRVAISKYTLDEKFIKDYPSYKEAAKSVGVTYTSIRNCICFTNTNKCRGFIWKIKKD